MVGFQMLSDIKTKLSSDLANYVSKRMKAKISIFRNLPLTDEKIKLANKLIGELTDAGDEDLQTLNNLRSHIQQFRLDNAVLEVKHSESHLSYKQYRAIGKGPLSSYINESNTQSALQKLADKYITAIETELTAENEVLLPDTKFAIYSLQTYIQRELLLYLSEIDKPSGPLTNTKKDYTITALSILENVTKDYLEDISDDVRMIEHLKLLIAALHNSNQSIEKLYDKKHMSYTENRKHGLGMVSSIFKTTILQSRLNSLTEKIFETLADFKTKYNIDDSFDNLESNRFDAIKLGTLKKYMPEALTQVQEIPEVTPDSSINNTFLAAINHK